MKMLQVVFLFLSISAFAQENIINHRIFYNSYNSVEDQNQETISQKIASTLFFSGLAVATIGFNIWMREGVFQDNHSDNWWGTVNGVLTLGLAGTITGSGITFLIHRISGERFDEMYILLGSTVGLISGVALAFFPPFFQGFRENQYLYYLYPGIMATAFIGGIFDTWFGRRNKSGIDLAVSPTINNFGYGVNILFSRQF